MGARRERFARYRLSRVIRPLRHLRRNQTGAEAVEFALVAPILFFLLFGLLYVMLLFAAQLSLSYATAVGARYAAIRDAATLNYPSASDVGAKIDETTPFFSADSCSPVLTSSAGPNTEMRLEVACDFPNPAGSVVAGLRNTFFGGGNDAPSTVTLSAAARARKE